MVVRRIMTKEKSKEWKGELIGSQISYDDAGGADGGDGGGSGNSNGKNDNNSSGNSKGSSDNKSRTEDDAVDQSKRDGVMLMVIEPDKQQVENDDGDGDRDRGQGRRWSRRWREEKVFLLMMIICFQ